MIKDRIAVIIKPKSGLSANINTFATKNLATQGEMHYTTDTNKLYIFDGSNNERVHGLDLAVVNDGEIVTNEGEVVWQA